MAKIKILILLTLINISAFSMTIKDVLGREVTILKPVKKIIALSTSLSYVTYLDSLDKVVAIESMELKDLKKRTYTYVNRNKIKHLPIVGHRPMQRPNLEAILSLKPDLIFTISFNKSDADLLAKQLNIPIVVVGYGRKSIDFKEVYKSFNIMGKILKKEKRAKELINYIKHLQKEFIKPKVTKSAYIGAVAYKGKQGITSTKTDFMPFRIAYINNISSSLQKKGPLFIDKEYLLSKNPSYLFIDTAGLDLIKDDFKKNPEFFKKLSAFEKSSYLLLANTFYYINIDQMLANSFFIAKTVYPQLYKNLNPIKKADEIFKFFVKEPLYKVLEEDSGGYKRISIKNDNLKLESL